MPGRLSVIEQVIHYSDETQQPTDNPNTFTRILKSEGAHCSRPDFKVGEEWKPLPTGWIEEDGDTVGLVVIVNNEGKILRVNPTPEEASDTAAKVIEVRCGETGEPWLLPPGESFRGTPGGKVWLRCRKGVAKLTVIVYPG